MLPNDEQVDVYAKTKPVAAVIGNRTIGTILWERLKILDKRDGQWQALHEMRRHNQKSMALQYSAQFQAYQQGQVA